MHYNKIDREAPVTNGSFDLEDDGYGYRPVQLTSFAVVDGSNLLVPVAQDDREGMTVALTDEQAMQALLELADQLGHEAALKAIKEAAG